MYKGRIMVQSTLSVKPQFDLNENLKALFIKAAARNNSFLFLFRHCCFNSPSPRGGYETSPAGFQPGFSSSYA